MVCCITDNAVKQYKGYINYRMDPPSMPGAYTSNLIGRDAFKGLKLILDKVKETVEYFHRSTLKTTQI